ncbi:hypothetical protein [Helicobacter pylori]|uniref:hypothetical protein n=1 Tax=Helicobacter pylori TaxID=210 RepID=UPI001F362458|nr:hypothetical protein [Helicobacter pylori]
MKSVELTPKDSSNLPTQKGNSKGSFDNFSSADILKVIIASKDLTQTVINAKKEIIKEQEKTKQAEIQANQEIIASDNRLIEKLAEFERDIIALNNAHEQEMRKLSDEHEKVMKYLEMVQDIINKIDSLQKDLIHYREQGKHQIVDDIYKQLIFTQQNLLALVSKAH